MKNAQLPGVYCANAHDYRPDLARFVREVFDLPCSDEQLARVEDALEAREALRERLFSDGLSQDDPPETTEPASRSATSRTPDRTAAERSDR